MTSALITIHGFMTDPHDFGALRDVASQRYDEVFNCVLPGHCGEDNKEFTTWRTLDVVLKNYDTLCQNYDRVDIVGFSLGGALATWLCAMRNVHKAVFVAPANVFMNAASPVRIATFYTKTFFNGLKADGNWVERLKTTGRSLKPYWENSRMTLAIGKNQLLPNYNLHTMSVFADLIKTINDKLEEVGQLDTPSLLLWGKLDEMVPYSSVEYVGKLFKNMKTEVIPDVGHPMLMTNKSREISEEIVKFLQK